MGDMVPDDILAVRERALALFLVVVIIPLKSLAQKVLYILSNDTGYSGI